MNTHKTKVIITSLLAFIVIMNVAVAQKQVSVYKPLPENFHPGSITFAGNGDLFVASMKTGEIVRFTNSSGKLQVFVSREIKLGAAMGIKVDENRKILWVCSADLGLNSEAPNAGSYLNAFDLGTGLLVAKYPLPDGGLANDLAIASNGTIYVTDSKNPRVLILRNNSNKLIPFLTDTAFDAGGGFGLDGIVCTADNSLLVSKFSEGKVIKISRIDSNHPNIRSITFDRKLSNTDGIYYTGGNSFLLAEPDLTGHNGKILSVTFDNSFKATITEIQTGLTMPVNAVENGGKIYFVEVQLAPLLIPERKNDVIKPFAVKSVPLTY